MSMKNPLTLAGIEPATFRFVAQHLNHCATAVRPLGTLTEIFVIYMSISYYFLPVFGARLYRDINFGLVQDRM